ncbi:uncharacterized protein LOC130713063 [Lotus japonicus]|uniref:uncharacterized protein LOC130713063 n=1 Tax=Lotus japonicus TaxID=34305 RepID=UPI0025896C17|nr:uncharacterized protein LOC130713063 [Lotus japonicus]
MGGGGLLRDNNCTWIVGFMSFDVGGDPFLAEATTLRDRLLLTWRHGHRNVLCNVLSEVDCAALVEVQNADRRRHHEHAPNLEARFRNCLTGGLAWHGLIQRVNQRQNGLRD